MEGTTPRCRKCGKLIPEVSIYCLYCGAEQNATKRRKRTTRRPNGSGTVRKMPGNRREPYAAYLPSGMGGSFIGSYRTSDEASNALAVAIAARPKSERSEWTITDFYDDFVKTKYFAKLTQSTQNNHRNAWKYFAPISDMRMRDVKKSHLQAVIESAQEKGVGYSVCAKIRSLASLLCQNAMSDDVIDKNYAELLELPKNTPAEKDVFTAAEIQKLFSHDSNLNARLILILIYTGLRISELLDVKKSDVNTEYWYLTGGNKTEAGRNRTVPIIKTIRPYVQDLINDGDSEYLIHMPTGKKMSRDYFAKYIFKGYLVEIGILTVPKDGESWRLSPHSARHTFASLGRKAGIDKDILARIIGHVDYDAVTDKHYVELDSVYLSGEMEKLDRFTGEDANDESV